MRWKNFSDAIKNKLITIDHMVKLSKEQIQSLLGTLEGAALKLQVENLLKLEIQNK